MKTPSPPRLSAPGFMAIRAGLGGAARDALDRCGILLLGNVGAGRLTLLQRKRLELARAIATRPRLLLLDEVAGGLTDGEMAQLLELVTAINASGVTVLWIEHLVHALVSVARRLIVLAEGRVIADGVPKLVLQDRTVREVYLGADIEATEGSRATH